MRLGDQDRTELADDPLRFAQHDLGDGRVLVPRLRPLDRERRRLDVGQLDRAALGLGDDLARHHERRRRLAAACRRRSAASDDHRREIGAGLDLGQPGDAEDLHDRSSTESCTRCGAGGMRNGPTWQRGLRDLRPVGVARSARLRLHRHHLPPRRRPRHGAHRVQPARGAQRVPPAHRRRAVHRARPRPDEHRRRLRAAHRQRPVAEGRRLGVLQRRRPAHPRPRRLQVHAPTTAARWRDRARIDAGSRRAAAHPRGAAADPVHAQGRHLRRARLGGRWRPQPARRQRPHDRQPRARPVQADRRRRRELRRRLRVGVPRPPGRPEVRPRDLLPRRRVHRRRRAPDGHGERRRPPRRARGDGARVGDARSTARARPRSGC